MELKRPFTTVGALVQEPGGRYLIVRTTKWRGAWGVPGGKVEYGETLEAALKREFLEEVGLKLDRVRFATVQEAVLSPEFGEKAHFVLLNYLADTEETQVTPGDEIEAWAWVTLDEALGYPLNSFTQVLVEHARRA